MKTRFLFAALTALLLLPVKSLAQLDSRAPGIYAIVGEESIQLPFTRSTVVSTGFGDGFVTISRIYYSGATSGVTTSERSFVLVVDPKKATFTNKKPFVKKLTPDNMKFLPVISDPEKNRREYEAGVKVAGGLIYEEEYGIKFEWERISDNSFKITIPDNLEPGEYGFSFCLHRLSPFDYFFHIFGFTIPEKQ